MNDTDKTRALAAIVAALADNIVDLGALFAKAFGYESVSTEVARIRGQVRDLQAEIRQLSL